MLHCLLLGLLSVAPPQDAPRFDYFGTMDSVVSPGCKIAPVTAGLPFEIVLSDAGAKVSGTDFDLKPTGCDKTFHLSFSGLAFADGGLKGKAEIKNATGSSLQGLRLDVVSATETYKAPTDADKAATKTREVSVKLASPLSFGDEGDGESNGALDFDVSRIEFKPETVSISIRGVVSGVRYARSISLPTVGTNGEIDVDSAGKIYLSDVSNQCVSRVDNDGTNLVQLCKLPDQCKGMAVNPVSGEIGANCANHGTIYFFDANGTDTGKLADDVLENYSDYQRYDAHGRLWSNVTSTYVGFSPDRKPNAKIEKFGDFDATGDRFDVAPDGTFYAVANNDTVFVRHPDGQGGVFAKGNGAKLGQLFGANSVRVGPDGLIYVAEDGADNVPYGTITVYDASGRVVRAFGRGAKKPMDNWPDGYWPSQLYNPSDLAFGRDGTVYVDCASRDEDGVNVKVYVPF